MFRILVDWLWDPLRQSKALPQPKPTFFHMADQKRCTFSTADVAANSPRFRRKSSPFVDAIHDLPEKLEMAPAQLYSTESGRLFHSGRIAIATVGLPARGKTYVLAKSTGFRWQTPCPRDKHMEDLPLTSLLVIYPSH